MQRLIWCFECELLLVERNTWCFEFCRCGRKTWWFCILQYDCAVEKKRDVLKWMQRYYFVDRQKKRDVFDETPMVFFLFQKSTFVINENNITQNWNMDFFFFRFFIIYQLKIWWRFWRDMFGKRDVFIVILWKNIIFLVSDFEQKSKFVLFWKKRQSFRKVFRSKCDDFYCKNHDVFDTAIRFFFPFKTLPFYHKFSKIVKGFIWKIVML